MEIMMNITQQLNKNNMYSITINSIRLALGITLAVFTSQVNAQYVAPTGNLNPDSRNIRQIRLNPGMSNQRMQNLINSQPRRAKRVLFTQGSYQIRTLLLIDNTHIRFERGVTIHQTEEGPIGPTSGTSIFTIRNVSNVSVVGHGGNRNSQTKIIGLDVPEDEDSKQHFFSAASIRASSNFLIAQLNIEGDYTRSNHITTGRDANQGTIRNIVSTGNAPGFGLYQGFGGTNIVLRDLDGTGGYTLRLEQNAQEKQISFQSPLDNIDAANIICRNGRAGAYVNPALFDNGGEITIDNITAIGCGWAIEIGAKSPGLLSRVTVTNIEARFGTRAQYLQGAEETRALIPDV